MRMTICFQFDFIYFVQFNWHLIGRKVNHQAVIFQRIKFDNKSSWTFSFDFFVKFGEFVQLDVECPIKPKQTTRKYALSSTASEEIQQSRDAGPPERPQPEARQPLAQSRPPKAPQKK